MRRHSQRWGSSCKACRRFAAELTPRQRQVLVGLATSATIKRIAAQWGRSAKTAEYHKAKLCRRLRIHDIAGLTRFAIRSGLIKPYV